MAAGLRLVTERASGAAGQPVFDDENDEELMHMQPGVSIVLGNRPPKFPDTLYIFIKQVVWLSNTDRAKGYVVDFLSVSLHAVSRDLVAYPFPCIYTQLCAELNPDTIEDEEDGHNWNISADQIEGEGSEYEDSEWNISQNSTHTIGANGNNDLTHSVVQVYKPPSADNYIAGTIKCI